MAALSALCACHDEQPTYGVPRSADLETAAAVMNYWDHVPMPSNVSAGVCSDALPIPPGSVCHANEKTLADRLSHDATHASAMDLIAARDILELKSLRQHNFLRTRSPPDDAESEWIFDVAFGGSKKPAAK